MTRTEAKDYILDHSRDYFQRDKSRKGYICPICGSGSGKKGTGITTKDGKHFTCWGGCFSNADVFEIITKQYSLRSFPEALEEACKAFNISIDRHFLQEKKKPGNRQKTGKIFTENSGENSGDNFTENRQKTGKNLAGNSEKTAKNAIENKRKTTEKLEDFSDLYKEAHSNLYKTDYMQRRGISKELCDQFSIGYIEKWKHPKAPANTPATPRIIIPITRYSYLARDTRSEIPEDQKGFAKSKAKAEGLEKASWTFNAQALKTSQDPIFILEGEIDALSVMEVGGEAVALGSTAYRESFLDLCRRIRPSQPLIIALDNDEAGQTASEEISKELEKIGLCYVKENISLLNKDANEALINDREALKSAIREAKRKALYKLHAMEKEREEKLKERSITGKIRELKDRQANGEKPQIISTGFAGLDRLLDEGFRAGLYTIGAISSLGKTSFIIQLADNVAKQGVPVLYVSLEMASEELIAKILSRLTFEKSEEKYNSFNTAKTTLGIMDAYKYKTYPQDHREIIDEAIEELEGRSDNLFILEGIGNIGVAEVKEKALELKDLLGVSPVIFIDYLQILAPDEDFRGTDKQAVDKSVIELKRMSRDLKTPVICVSSFGRQNYDEPVMLSSFKESGAIEYTSDVLIGLQYKGMDYLDEKDKERKARIKEISNTAEENAKAGRANFIELKVLKNRNGSKGKRVFDFTPMFNCYEEDDPEADYAPVNDMDYTDTDEETGESESFFF